MLLKDQYVTEVLNVMNQKHSVTFRDQAELHQATQFLHDNGVLLHYDDISLKVDSFDPACVCYPHAQLSKRIFMFFYSFSRTCTFWTPNGCVIY